MLEPCLPLSPHHLPESLPVSGKRDEIEAALREHQVIVCGETGSGKTTSVAQDRVGHGPGRLGQPRAASTAGSENTAPPAPQADRPRNRAALPPPAWPSALPKNSTPLGEVVGYRCASGSAATGRQRQADDRRHLAGRNPGRPDLQAYDTLIIDEAHERSLNIDFLLGYLRQLLPRRPGSEDHRYFGHDRCRPVCQALRIGQRAGAGHHGVGPPVPG